MISMLIKQNFKLKKYFFQKVRSFVWLLSFFLFERFGDEYFSWWYVQHMLPYGTGIVFVHSFL